jgi:hypothetical protein
MAEEPGTLRIDLLESSFVLLAPRAEELIERFYARLFTVALEGSCHLSPTTWREEGARCGRVGMIMYFAAGAEKLGSYLDGLGPARELWARSNRTTARGSVLLRDYS